MILNQMIQPGFKLLAKHENMGCIYPVCLSSKLAIKTLAGWGKTPWLFCSHVIHAQAFQIEILIQNCAR